jgi:hypothetical protein
VRAAPRRAARWPCAALHGAPAGRTRKSTLCAWLCGSPALARLPPRRAHARAPPRRAATQLMTEQRRKAIWAIYGARGARAAAAARAR